MKLLGLTASNFLLLGEVDIDFEPGLFFVDGENRDYPGSDSNQTGKSSLIEAMVWCFYGKTIRNIPVDEVVNENTDGDCVVAISFSVGEHVYRVERGRGRGAQGKPSLKLFMDGKDITPAQQAQRTINELVGMDYGVFITVCVFAKNTGQYNFIEKTNAEQKKNIENLIDFSRFEAYLSEVKERLTSLEEQHSARRTDLHKLEQHRTDLNDEGARIEGWIAEIEEKAGRSFRPIGDIESDIDNESHYLSETRADYDAVLQKKIRAEETAEKHKREHNNTLSDKKRLEEKDTLKVCPTCHQPLPPQDHSALIAQYAEKVKAERKLYEEAEKIKEEHVVRCKSFQLDIQSTEAKLKQLRTELGEAQKAGGDIQKYRERLNDISGSLAVLDREEEALRDKINDVIDLKSHYEFLKQAFSRDGIESYILDQILPFLNEHANSYLRELSDGRMVINFATLKEGKRGGVRDEFNVQVRATAGARSYGGCSGSEESFADFATALAKRDLARSFGDARGLPPVLFIDEVLGAVDTVGARRFCDFLNALAKEIGTVWFITHNQTLRDLFENRILVVREGGITNAKSSN